MIIFILKNILEKLDILKINRIKLLLYQNDYSNFKNIKNLSIDYLFDEDGENNKFLHREILQGNINLENLKRLKLTIPYDIQIKNINKNENLLNFVKICSLKGNYDNSNAFFIEFFKYIFRNANIDIITYNKKLLMNS